MEKLIVVYYRLMLKIGNIFSRFKKYLIILCGFIILFFILFLFYYNPPKIVLEADLSGFFPLFFITIGAAMLGVLAITFALSLFAVQQAAERYTPLVLDTILKDKINKKIFWSIVCISLFFFLLAFLPYDNYFKTALGLLLIVLIFFLIKKQFSHTSELINPIKQFEYFYKECIKYLKKINAYFHLSEKAKLFQYIFDETDKNKSAQARLDKLKTEVIKHIPEIFYIINEYLTEICTIIQTYQKRKDYQVTQSGFNYIYEIIKKYIKVKNGAFKQYEDFCLNQTYRKLSSIQRVASQEKDLEISSQVIDCFYLNARQCTEIRYRKNLKYKYIHYNITTNCMIDNIELCLTSGLNDIGIKGSYYLGELGVLLIKKSAFEHIIVTLENLKKIANYYLSNPSLKNYISHQVNAICRLLHESIFSNSKDSDILSTTILWNAQQIIGHYINKNEPGAFWADIDIALGPIFKKSSPRSIPNIFNEALIKIKDKNISEQYRKILTDRIIEFSKELNRITGFYAELSKYAAKNESYLIIYISSSLDSIAISLLKLYQMDILENNQKKEIINNMDFILFNYLSIFKNQDQITKDYEKDIIANLLNIGYEIYKIYQEKKLAYNNYEIIFYGIIHIIISIACEFLKKEKLSLGLRPINIIKKASYLCLLDNSNLIYSNFMQYLQDSFWTDFLQKYSDSKRLFFNILLGIKTDKLKFAGMSLTPVEKEIMSKLNNEDIEKFVNRLSNDLK